MHAYSGGSRTLMLGVLATIAVVLAVAASFAFQLIDFEYDWLLSALVSAPTIAGAFGLLYAFVDKVAWRWRWISRLGLIDTPLVEGEYVGTLRSKVVPEGISVRIRIDQTWTRMRVRFDLPGRETSDSTSVAASLAREGHDGARLVYTYKNQVRPATADDDMRDHDGTADVHIERSGKLAGRYFNARGRQGELALMREAQTARSR